MKKHDTSLFQIGEVVKILGISRKTILNYETLGLLTPAVKDENSGYRYYTADNMTHIRSIRSLQILGLSLKEISEYYHDLDHIDHLLQQMMDLRSLLDQHIQTLQVRSSKVGDLTVHPVTLPRQVCFCRRYQSADVAEASNNLRETYIAAARTGFMSKMLRMFTVRMNQNPDIRDFLCCIPVDESFSGPERIEFAETPALCIYYRGSYEEIGSAVHALTRYVNENNVQTTGEFRSIYMEGPPNRGENSADYITQIAVPTAGFIEISTPAL